MSCLQYKYINANFIIYKMGSKCFRPVNEHNQPVYVNSINNAFNEANKVQHIKKGQKVTLKQEIIKSEHSKGNLKKLFDHLNCHQKNILPAIKQCNKKISSEKSFSSGVVGCMFCEQLVKMLSSKKINLSNLYTQNNRDSAIKYRKHTITNEFTFRNMIHQIESHFFQLVTKILAYNIEKITQNCISETLINYIDLYDQKITAKKQLTGVLDLYLNLVFQKNMNRIDKNSFLPYYAYSTLISKSKSQLFTADFIDKHFNFILKLFFELEDTRSSCTVLIKPEDFRSFEDSVQSIIKQFILSSQENKKIKDHVLSQLMLQEDAEKFDPVKTKKLQKVVQESLSSYSREHFMFDWLGYLVKYIGRKTDNDNQSIIESFKEYMQQIHLHTISKKKLKNMVTEQSKINAMQTLKRWFVKELLNTQKMMQYFSSRIFQALLLNLYNPQGNNEQVSMKAQQVLKYLLQRKPRKLLQILIILNNQLRKNKNQYFFTEHHNTSTIETGVSRPLTIIEEQAIDQLWKNDIDFIIQELKMKNGSFKLSFQQVEQIYAPVVKGYRPSINLLYLIQLAALSLQYTNLENQKFQVQVYNFLISITNSIKVPDSEIQFQYIRKFIDKNKCLLNKISHQNEAILYTLLKYNFKNLLKENQGEEVWTQVLITIILIYIIVQEKKGKSSERLKKLESFLKQILDIIQFQNCNSNSIYQIYHQNKSLFDFAERFSAHLEKIKLKSLQNFEHGNEIPQKSIQNVESSALSSRFEVSDSNPDTDFKNMYKMATNK